MRMPLRLLLTLVLPAMALAQAPPPVTAGMPYATAREALLRAGWEPMTVADADRCSPRDRRCQGRPEMTACAGTGLGECLFAWRRGTEEIEVITVGEETIVRDTRRR